MRTYAGPGVLLSVDGGARAAVWLQLQGDDDAWGGRATVVGGEPVPFFVRTVRQSHFLIIIRVPGTAEDGLAHVAFISSGGRVDVTGFGLPPF